MNSVKDSPWAEGVRDSHQRLTESVPAVLETNFADWQERVDNPSEKHDIGGFIGYLHTVRAIEYETVMEGERKISRPSGAPDRTYFVTADSGYRAMDIVRDYLKQQAPSKSFGFGAGRSVTILQKES